MVRVRLLGELIVERDGAPVALAAQPARLLAFLAVAAGPQDRAKLAGRFWPEATAAAARASLRTAIWALRKAIGDEAVVASRTTVSLERKFVRVDLDEFRDLVTRGEAEAAEELCREELLPIFDDDWVLTARQEYRSGRLALLDTLAEQAARDGDHSSAVRWAVARCALGLLDEQAHRALLHHLLAAGDRAAALLAGAEFEARIRRELGVDPSAATRAVLAQVRGAAAPSAGAALDRDRAPMFGRRAELAELTAAWSAARTGQGRVVVITGEGGIGKTRLVAELARRADNAGARVAVGAGIDVGGQAPFAVWQELARELVSTVPRPAPSASWPLELGRLAPDLAAALGQSGSPPVVASPELERLRIFDAVLRLVEWAAASRPLVLVAEDVHRADGTSMQLCAHIGRRLADLPVLFVLSRRDRPVHRETDALLADLVGRGLAVQEIVLEQMSDSELAAVARSIASLADTDIAQVVTAAEGNPLLAVESARMLAAGSVEPPPNLRVAVRAAIGSLPPVARDLVETLAAAGRELSGPEIDALALPDRTFAEAHALEAGLVRRHRGGLAFRHALLAEAARVDLSDPAGRHHQVAGAIETAGGTDRADLVAAEVARHLQQAGRDDLAAPQWERAAAHARSLGALSAAAGFWTEAVSCRPAAPAPRLELAEVHGWLGRPEDFEREWQCALELFPVAERSVAWARRGLVLRTVVCWPSGSLRAYRTAWDLLTPQAPEKLRTALLIGTAWGEASAGDPAAAEELLERLRAALPDPDAETAAEMENIRLMTLTRLGRFAECEGAALRAGHHAELARRQDLAYGIWLHTSCACSAAGDLDAALRCADRALTASRGIAVLELPCHAARAFVLARMGHAEQADAAAAEQLSMAERMDSVQILALARHDAGLIALAVGRNRESAELLDAALSEEGEINVNRPAARLARAEALAACGEVDAARAEVRAAVLESVRPGDQPWALVPRMARVQGLVALAAGDPATGRKRLTEALDGWHRLVRPAAGEELFATFVDLGRPPIVGLVEPAREIERLLGELSGIVDAPTAGG